MTPADCILFAILLLLGSITTGYGLRTGMKISDWLHGPSRQLHGGSVQCVHHQAKEGEKTP